MRKPPTPWTLRAEGEANQYCLLDASGNWVAHIKFNGEMLLATQEAIAGQWVACVNADKETVK